MIMMMSGLKNLFKWNAYYKCTENNNNGKNGGGNQKLLKNPTAKIMLFFIILSTKLAIRYYPHKHTHFLLLLLSCTFKTWLATLKIARKDAKSSPITVTPAHKKRHITSYQFSSSQHIIIAKNQERWDADLLTMRIETCFTCSSYHATTYILFLFTFLPLPLKISRFTSCF